MLRGPLSLGAINKPEIAYACEHRPVLDIILSQEGHSEERDDHYDDQHFPNRKSTRLSIAAAHIQFNTATVPAVSVGRDSISRIKVTAPVSPCHPKITQFDQPYAL